MKNFYKKLKKISGSNKGEMTFATEILLFILIVFILWVLAGGSQKQVENDSLFVPMYTTVN